MKLHENQIELIKHLIHYRIMDYENCLWYLDPKGEKDRTERSYMFRPLTKHKYLSKRKDGSVTVLAKSRELFPYEPSIVTLGGGAASQKRSMTVSRMAALMELNGIPSSPEPVKAYDEPYFIPSARWRKIAPGILSTTRFVGMLMMGEHRLAVYDIGSGEMEWQIRAEGSLFYSRHSSYETRATGMLFVCAEEARVNAAQQIIRHTMWNRRQLLQESYDERDKPTRWSQSPIKLKAQYRHVYLTTPERLLTSLQRITGEPAHVQFLCDMYDTEASEHTSWDVEVYPRRLYSNPATDLLKYVYFFSHVKADIADDHFRIGWEVIAYEEDLPIAHMYPALEGGMTVHVYRSS